MDVAGEEYTIPAMCAADWLNILMNPKLRTDHIFPGMLDEAAQARVDELLHTGVLELQDVEDLGREIVTQVSGRPWYVALRLLYVAMDAWDALGGEMAMKADASKLPLAAWLDVLFLLINRNIENEKRTMFLMKLELPPEGSREAPEEMEMSADAFMAMSRD